MAALSATASFAYCEADNSLIWRLESGQWQEDHDYIYFRELASALHGPEIGSLVLGYFKRYCASSLIDLDLKKARLALTSR